MFMFILLFGLILSV